MEEDAMLGLVDIFSHGKEKLSHDHEPERGVIYRDWKSSSGKRMVEKKISDL